MSLLDDRSRTSSDAPEGPPRPDDPGLPTESPPGPATSPTSTVLTWLLVLAAGLVGGFAGFGIGEFGPRIFRPSLDLPPEIRRNSSQVPIVIEKRMAISRDRTATLAYGGLGMVLGLALGIAGGLARRSPMAAIAAGVTGLVLGGAAGAGSTVALVPFYHAARAAASQEDYTKDIGVALCMHAGIWATIGAAAGLALGIGLGNGGRIARSVVGGIVGAVIAGAIYEFGGAMLFPIAETFRPTAAEMLPRLFGHLTAAICIAIGALMFANHMTVRRAKPLPIA